MEMKVSRPQIPPGQRVLVISDVHGNLPFLQALLDQVGYGGNDVLLLLGDLLEKGLQSLDTLRYVMALAGRHTVYALCGNCDYVVLEALKGSGGITRPFLQWYLNRWGERCCLVQMAQEAGLPLTTLEDLPALQALARERFAPELAFLEAMPVVLEAGRFLFVHGGVPRTHRLEELDPWGCMKCDAFLCQGRAFSTHWIVVGHWPVTLYHPSIPSAAPLIHRARQIISIDGGCSLKLDGQLNALILPHINSTEFSWASYDGLPMATALDAQEPSRRSRNIRWSENEVDLLEHGEEFSLCRHCASGDVMPILTEFLYQDGASWRCEDATDYRLSVSPGDQLSVVRATSQGYLCKKAGVTGWYLGRLQDPPAF